MARIAANGIEIEYELTGPSDCPVLMLIHGVGAQLVRWDAEFIDLFHAAGFRVLRFDNRDIGLSTHMSGMPVPDLAEVVAARGRGEDPELPYTLDDMARDTVSLLDALGIVSAHLLGVSMGGMIAQILATRYPDRVLSLAILMSQSGNPDLPPSQSDALAILAKPAPDPDSDREAFLDHQVLLNRTLGSPAYPTDHETLRAFAALAADRGLNPAGAARQLAASRGAPDRRSALSKLAVPTVVIHGVDDPLLPVESAKDMARCIADSWLVEIGGMGHDLPAALFDMLSSLVIANARRAEPD